MNIKYNNTDNSFKNDLLREINAYFEKNNISKYGNWNLRIKTIFFLILIPVLYVCIVFYTPDSTGAALFLCALLGLVFAGVGFNIMHDASHGAYSKKRWVNEIMVRSLELLGASSPLWKKKHVVLHHSYVNTVADEDISFYPLIRTLKDEHKKLFFHRFQAFYAPLLYCLLYISWVAIMDFRKYFSGKVHGHSIKMSKLDHVLFWVSKISYAFIFLILPWMLIGFVPMLIGFSVCGVTCGFVISIVFQLAHVVETSTFPMVDKETGKIEVSWAESQVRETSDFAVNSKVISWLVGGLNFQTVHHLFPNISHVHYPKMSGIVESVCKKHNITYNKISFFGAIRSHFKTLYKLGVA
ncbi:MAG: acyl-CoA desaturase [Candidatus Pacebacteria bacterium]|nr:acyl-CoA desaturase [Candidatus Paceibacterota bacterium]MBP9772489.1 acyl-CoA desaturase [Candidatus Paceibacterota bacterium]